MARRVVSKAQHFDFNRDPLFGDERMKFLLIKDTKNFSGYNLFKTILNLYCKSNVNVRILCIDGLVENVIDGINLKKDKSIIIDEFSKFITWQNNRSISDDYLKNFSGYEGLLCIFSLTSLIVYDGDHKIYKFIHKLLTENSKLQILTLMHQDVHLPKVNNIFDSLATTVIDTINEDNSFMMTASTRNKAYGKTAYKYKILPTNFSFESVEVVLKSNSKLITKKPDPTANLTFNLNIKAEEKKTKDKLQMPYMKTEVVESVTTQDLEDFYEEDDPDDDLDFLEAV